MIRKTALQLLSSQTLDEWAAILSEGFDQKAGSAIRQALQVVIRLENIKPVMPRGIDVDPATITEAILSDGRLTVQQDIEQKSVPKNNWGQSKNSSSPSGSIYSDPKYPEVSV